MNEHRNLLQRVSAEYGVPARFVLALWRLETNFGDYQGDYPLISALATLAHDARRGALLRKQLLAALRIVDEGHQNPAQLKGSWAGAMDQLQRMPTTSLDYAVDCDADGRKDTGAAYPTPSRAPPTTSREPAGAAGTTWDREVNAPASLDGDSRALAGMRSLADWRGGGVVWSDGGALPSANARGKMVMLAARLRGGFLVYSNFDAILRWNQSILFDISVGAFVDEFSGAASLRACRS